MSDHPENTDDLIRSLDAGSAPDPERAWRRIQTPRQSRRFRLSYVAAGLVAVTIAAVLSFAPLRAFASSFLAMFRVQQINVVRIDPGQLKEARSRFFQDEDSPQMEQFFSENLHSVQHGERVKAATLEQAAKSAGIGLRTSTAFDSMPSQYVVQPAVDVTFKIDLEQIHEILTDAGRPDIRLPESIDGETVQLAVPRSVASFYGTCPDPQSKELSPRDRIKYDQCKVLIQMPVPTLAAPEGFDMRRIGEAFLQLSGLSKEDAERISSQVDWASTLVLPLPVDPDIAHSEVEVDGVKANLTVVKKQHMRSPAFNLVWIRDGVLYCLMGKGTQDEAIRIASLMR